MEHKHESKLVKVKLLDTNEPETDVSYCILPYMMLNDCTE